MVSFRESGRPHNPAVGTEDVVTHLRARGLDILDEARARIT